MQLKLERGSASDSVRVVLQPAVVWFQHRVKVCTDARVKLSLTHHKCNSHSFTDQFTLIFLIFVIHVITTTQPHRSVTHK